VTTVTVTSRFSETLHSRVRIVSSRSQCRAQQKACERDLRWHLQREVCAHLLYTSSATAAAVAMAVLLPFVRREPLPR